MFLMNLPASVPRLAAELNCVEASLIANAKAIIEASRLFLQFFMAAGIVVCVFNPNIQNQGRSSL
jgi:hypothetical protein